MSKQSDQEFITQSVRKISTIKNSTVSEFENDGAFERIIVKYLSDWYCKVTFDDWVTKKWISRAYNGSNCCYIKNNDICYSWKETWISGVSYDDQLTEEDHIAVDTEEK